MSDTSACRESGRLAGRIALITGASRGLGRAVAIRFAREGALPILVGRTQGALEEVDDEIRKFGGSASLVPANLADHDVIVRMGAAVLQRWGRLDILVGNAADLGVLGPVGHMDPKVWEHVLAVNLTANWMLIRSMDPLLRASPSGRAIFVTSGVSPGRAYWGAYAVSKAGLESLVRTYAQEIEKTNVRVNLLDPGPTRTMLRMQAFPGENPETLPEPETRTDHFVELAEAACTANGETIRIA